MDHFAMTPYVIGNFFHALADRDRVNFSLFHISKCLTEIVEEELER
jgi:hypothetical protein